VHEHRGNGEHPQSLERRRQLLVWGSLAVLIGFGEALGLIRLVLEWFSGEGGGSLAYQAIVLAVNGVLGLLVLLRVRSLRQQR
jgi:hypothetical protein